MMYSISEEQFKQALPQQMHKRVNQEILDVVNSALTDPGTAEMMRENIISYSSILQEGRFKIPNYIDAVKYVSFKVMGDTNKLAYKKTFPVKYQNFVDSGVSDADISKYISAYNKSKLVNLILAQTIVPLHVLNMDKEQEAINHLAYLMKNAKSEKVQADSANSLLVHLKRPEVQKVELDIGVKDSNVIADLKQTTMELAAQQKRMLDLGIHNAKDVAQAGLVIEHGE